MAKRVKQVLCLVLIAMLVLSMLGCNSEVLEKDGKYYDSNGNEITDVTLDVVAQAHHSKNFKACDEKDRKDVLRRYLKYHAAAYDISDELIETVFRFDIEWDSAEALEDLEDFMDEQGSVLSLVNLYAGAKKNKDLAKFTSNVGNVTEIAGTAFHLTRTFLLVLDMSNNDISDPEEYCYDLLNTLSAAAGLLPVFDDFYSDAIALIRDGVQILIKHKKNYEVTLDVYTKEISQSTLFSIVEYGSDPTDWSLIAHPGKWKNNIHASHAPTLEDISRKSYLFPNMDAEELEYVKAYILYLLANPPEADAPVDVTPPLCVTDTIPAGEMLWYGYGGTSMAASGGTRYDLQLSSIDDNSIQGTLTRSYLYGVKHETKFTGNGTERDGKIEYVLHFETPAVLGTIPTFEYDQIMLTYDPTTSSFTMDDFYSVTMNHITTQNKQMIERDAIWSGYGKDSFYNAIKNDGHLFELHLSSLSESKISGKLTVSYEGRLDHSSRFEGRGYRVGDMIYFEVLLDTPRIEENIIEISIEALWLAYNCADRSLKTLSPCMYDVVMMPQ